MGIAVNLTTKELENIFGLESSGTTKEERAASSKQFFVRSQVQLAFASEGATGHRLTAREALIAYGIEVLYKVSTEGSAPLVNDSLEPANTFRHRREQLGLTVRQVAKKSGLDEALVNKAETPGAISPIRDLERLAAVLALDERKVGVIPGANGDPRLGVRLREIGATAGDAPRFSGSDVLALAESAWVISRQNGLEVAKKSRGLFKPSDDYTHPTYTRGFELAEKTRSLLGMTQDEPIASLRTLVEERLAIPVLQQVLNEKFAGATIANDGTRGIIVNEVGWNQNVEIRRMTIAHELGHVLWDPDDHLDSLTVDKYDDFESYSKNHKLNNSTNRRDNISNRDLVEMRANSFAIAFLAPPVGVERIASQSNTPSEAIINLISTYGISQSAARWHLSNVTRDKKYIDASFKMVKNLTEAWISQENLTTDFFPLELTPISRRGRFAWLVTRHFKDGNISADTASILLNCPAELFKKKVDIILDLGARTQI